MKTKVIKELGSFTVNDKVSQEELIKQIEQLEQEKAQSKIAAHETLLRCEEKYQTMLESVDEHITLVDRNLLILWANENAKEIFGRNIIGKSCCETLYGKNELCNDESSCMGRHAFHNGSTSKRHSMKMTTRDGSDKYFEGTARVVSWDDDGKPSVVAKIYKDITGRRLAEKGIARQYGDVAQESDRYDSGNCQNG